MLFETPSILLADDDHAFRDTIRGMLEPRGFRTYTAGNGEEALEIVEHEPVHLLMLDMHMPRLTGLDTVRRIRQLNSRLPCVLLSGALNEAIVQQARLADVFAVLAKPVSRCDITSAVDQIFRRVYGWPENEFRALHTIRQIHPPSDYV
jgi:CheY-like chemotaxis protein